MPVKKKPTAKQLAARKKFVEMVRARAKAKKSSKRQTGATTKSKDKKIQAKAPGKRIVKHRGAKSTTYTERRANRSDKGKLLGIGAVQSDLSSKYKKVVNNIAYLLLEIDLQKAIKKHAKNKAIHTAKIKKLSDQLKEQRKLKVKLSKFK